MITCIDPERIRILNDTTVRTGDYVLYWMQSSHRTEKNPALHYAIERANQAHLPLVVYFRLWQSYPDANLRHFQFMLEGLVEVARSLESLGIRFVLMTESPDQGVCTLAKNAAVVIVDRGASWCTAMVSFKCKDIGMDCKFEATAPNVQERDEKIAKHAREGHKIPNLNKEMWIKIHRAEK